MNKIIRSAFLLLVLFLPFCVPSTAAAGALPPDSQLQVTFFNVGKGDCILLRQGGKTMMIDTGYSETAPMVLSKLTQMKAASIDCLLLSHYDKDHVGGAAQIITSLPVGVIYGPDYTVEKKAYKEFIRTLKDKDITSHILSEETVKFQLGDMGIALYPPMRTNYMTSNDSSVICVVTFGNKRFAFMGDATDIRMKDFLMACDSKYDFVKLPHHGMFLRKSAPFKAFLKTANPEYCVITDSPEYKEEKALLLMLEIYGVKKTYQTRYGEISLISDGETITMSQDVSAAQQ